MAVRKKAKAPAAPVAQNLEEVTRLVGRIGVIQRELTRRDADLGDALARIKEAAEETALPLKAELAAAQAAVQGWCEAHRYEITGGNKVKFSELATGKVLWRARPPKVGVRGVEAATCWLVEHARQATQVAVTGQGFEAIAAWLLKDRLERLLRRKVEIDKEAMLKDPEAARVVPGVTIGSEGEDFVIEPFEAPLVEAAA